MPTILPAMQAIVAHKIAGRRCLFERGYFKFWPMGVEANSIFAVFLVYSGLHLSTGCHYSLL